MYYTSSCLKKDCKSITLLYNMKYQRGDIIISENDNIYSSPKNSRMLILDCFIDNDNQNKFYEVKEIWNEWKTVRCININIIDNYTKLDKIYLRNKKIVKIINKI